MKQIVGFTKDLRQEVDEALKGDKKKDRTVYAGMSIENFKRIQCLVGILLREAEKKKEDAVATHQFYTELADTVKNYSLPEGDDEVTKFRIEELVPDDTENISNKQNK